MHILLVIAVALFAQPGPAHACGYRPPRTVAATPFQNAPVTIYRDSRGRSIGSSMPLGNTTIYRSR